MTIKLVDEKRSPMTNPFFFPGYTPGAEYSYMVFSCDTEHDFRVLTNEVENCIDNKFSKRLHFEGTAYEGVYDSEILPRRNDGTYSVLVYRKTGYDLEVKKPHVIVVTEPTPEPTKKNWISRVFGNR